MASTISIGTSTTLSIVVAFSIQGSLARSGDLFLSAYGWRRPTPSAERRSGRVGHADRSKDVRGAHQGEPPMDQASPCRSANAATDVRDETSSLAKMWSRWLATVRSLTVSAAAISRLVLPSATRHATSTSRLLSPPGSGWRRACVGLADAG